MASAPGESLDLFSLQTDYRSGARSPADVIETILERIAAYPDKSVWIHLVPRAHIFEQLSRAEKAAAAGKNLPLLGVPFSVKDNIDVAHMPTTAACPSFAYVPATSATVVDRLIDAGAILIGKNNLDQFATGLVGTRSPYGAVRNPFNPDYICGGSSSGSAAAVATGMVSFSLGTDTAGSGRVPAAFTNIVGLKPTRGRISTAGLLPACRSLDCMSVFALTSGDASTVASLISGYDRADIYSRRTTLPAPRSAASMKRFTYGVPKPDRMRFYDNAEAEALFHSADERMQSLGGTRVEIDFGPFARAATLLYDGPWLAERLWAVRDLMANEPDAILPITWSVIREARRFDAVATFDGFYELQDLCQQAVGEWEKMDLLLLPTTGTIYTLAEVESDPIRLNGTLGYYTSFTNLMDLCAMAVPSGFLSNGVPQGISLMGPADHDQLAIHIADRFHRSLHLQMGATSHLMPELAAGTFEAAVEPAPALVG